MVRGIRHDFKLFKKSKTHLLEPTSCLGDKGYQGSTELTVLNLGKRLICKRI